mgnify:CR=1 FL=1
MRPSVRFDVFKRDQFTCSYCGRKPPEVTLEVDHIIPKAEGGTDDSENLTTACWDCNRGKGATQLADAPPAIPDLKERTELAVERERQLRAYHSVKAAEAARRNAQIEEVWNYWFEVWRVESMSRWHTPHETALGRYVDTLGVDDVKRAMLITYERMPYLNNDCVKYLYGVLRGFTAETEGRKKQCTVCGKWLTIPKGWDTSIGYHHAECEQ